MLLTQEELQSLIEVKQRTPHELLGMHPLADGTGVVVRALVPDAAKIEVQPAREKGKPAFNLTAAAQGRPVRGRDDRGHSRLCV